MATYYSFVDYKEFLDEEKWNEMRGGIFKNVGYFGYGTNVLKSGICKYYRRELFDKFEWCIIDMLIFSTKTTGIFTNLINRLKILLMEEIEFSELTPVTIAIDLLENIENVDFKEKVERLVSFVKIVKVCKRSRSISYLNNRSRYYLEYEKIDDVVLDKVLKYKKQGDSDNLLKHGELFIKYLESDSYGVFNIFTLLMNNKITKDMSCGTRWRRKECVYLLWAILEDFMKEKWTKVFRLGLEMFFRKSMKERPAFGVWIIGIVWKMGKVTYKDNYDELFEKCKLNEDFNVKEYLFSREKIDINEDFVIKDPHVSKKYGMELFALNGSIVTNEDLSILGNDGEKLSKLYRDVKCGIVAKHYKLEKKKRIKFKYKTKAEAKPEPKYNNINIVEESELDHIEWNKFTNVDVLEKGVCGLKVCCIKVKYNGKSYILKEMRASFNLGRDYIFIDSLKKIFGINDLGMKRIQSDMGLERIDTNKKTLVKNWKLEKKDRVIYCMMNDFENIGDLGKNKHFLEKEEVFKETLKIMLYDGLFRSSDNILRNILVNKDGVLISIDEGDIFGKRKLVFNKNDWFKKNANIDKTKSLIKGIIDDWNLCSKIEIIENEMRRWKFEESKIVEMKERLANYKKIVLSEYE